MAAGGAGFLRLQAWLPIPSLRAINIYPHPRGDGSVDLVDAGMYTARCVHDIIRGLRAAGLDPCRIERIVVTHFHVDHLTGAAILAEATGAEVLLGRGELELVLSTGDPAPFIEAALKLFAENGMPREEIDLIRRSHPAMRAIEAYKALSKLDLKPLSEGDTVRVGERTYRVAEMPGHTPGHIALIEEGEAYAFTGDLVLQGITPHVTLHDPDTDPLGDYMASLERLAGLGLRLALPGHREPIEDPAGRAREILEHHRQRLDEVHSILEKHGEATGYQVAREVRWRVRYTTWDEYPPAERFFAMGEALAHLRRLEVEGRAERVERGGLTLWRPL
ncbi:MAG: MBL fold metallo-hydrolase [Desulfurococcales archaeon]|nr:MBL fold metallo-hydrolase [Desulfurococcales archaeon]